ncbi:hypothetical protein CJU90_3584 [Yarrowia sp. C11]|nr:hypothetical protein CKK34_5197 [Yarrowia sp. E02]KAG5367317.1 hypothetical protein CJU90_3584 [Yarrowia sp. C11]
MFINSSWEQYLQPIKDLVTKELEIERAGFESVKNQLITENTTLQRQLSSAQKEIAALKRQLEGCLSNKPAEGRALNVTLTRPNDLAKDITRMSTLRAGATSLKKLKHIVGQQVPLGPEDCPDHKKDIPEAQKMWNRLGMKVLDDFTYFGMRNIIFWIILVSNKPIDTVAVEIRRLIVLEKNLSDEKQIKAGK